MLLYIIQQCYPTNSPLATFGKWPFKCGEWVNFRIVQNGVGQNKTSQFNLHFYV
jgi:hypothetical protein